MIGIWGAEAFIDITVRDDAPANEGETLLNVPALAGEGLSRSDIDALFDLYVLPFSPRIASRDIRGKTSVN